MQRRDNDRSGRETINVLFNKWRPPHYPNAKKQHRTAALELMYIKARGMVL